MRWWKVSFAFRTSRDITAWLAGGTPRFDGGRFHFAEYQGRIWITGGLKVDSSGLRTTELKREAYMGTIGGAIDVETPGYDGAHRVSGAIGVDLEQYTGWPTYYDMWLIDYQAFLHRISSTLFMVESGGTPPDPVDL